MGCQQVEETGTHQPLTPGEPCVGCGLVAPGSTASPEARARGRSSWASSRTSFKPEDAPERIVIIDYTNWRGERRKRIIFPLPTTDRFCATPHHPEPQWVFDALDMEKLENGVHPLRTFSRKDIHSWEPAKP